MLDEVCDAAHAQPAHDWRSDFVADEIGKNGGVAGVHFDGIGNRAGDFISGRSFTEKFDVFGPRQSNERMHSGFGAGIEKPARRAVINANHVKPGFANLGEITRGLLWRSEIIT